MSFPAICKVRAYPSNDIHIVNRWAGLAATAFGAFPAFRILMMGIANAGAGVGDGGGGRGVQAPNVAFLDDAGISDDSPPMIAAADAPSK